ncbi:MAG: alpha-amylase family glycosyl hydrolase [Cyclobacteriaceae bacterium]|nr:alpha-amylase family glycosyl hydrolase [Cyclobacteriaceae bacterium]
MKNLVSLIFALFVVTACTKSENGISVENADTSQHTADFPQRAKDMTIYEVNIRQHTPEGTFKSFQEHLPRLRELGADILWIMPIQPIGKKNRKGSLGSYYSIRDYKSVNPEFGTLDDFKALVSKAHETGLLVILDWVPNHTAWDHTWITEHPEYYMTASEAKIVGKELGVDADYYKKKGMGELVYEADWDDIALLNHFNPATRAAMIDAMRFWVTETDIDGFRTDHAGHEIPMYFWEEVSSALNPLKDLFWLAEWDEPRMHLVFDATYEWGLLGLTEAVAKGNASAEDLHEHIQKDIARFGMHPFRLNMITNHDRNAWEGTIRERYGDGGKAFAVFSFTAYGAPVIYSGQEVGLNKRLKFFEKDTISWEDPDKYFPFYQKLNQLKVDNPALWNGGYGGMPEKLEDGNKDVFSFRRTKDQNTVIGIINMSGENQTVRLSQKELSGQYIEAFTGQSQSLGEIKMSPWAYMIFTKQQ